MMKLYWVLLGLGFYHGVNPAMGWLLAVALALKNRRYSILIIAQICLALGHFVAIGLIVFGFQWLKGYVSHELIRWLTLGLLVVFGIFHLFRQKHPSWFGMDVGYTQLFLWSLLIATAHGAGLMVLSFIIEQPSMSFLDMNGLIGVHTLGYLGAALAMGFVVYLGSLKLTTVYKSWINFDLIWALALLLSALLLLLTSKSHH